VIIAGTGKSNKSTEVTKREGLDQGLPCGYFLVAKNAVMQDE